jgi:phospholipase C
LSVDALDYLETYRRRPKPQSHDPGDVIIESNYVPVAAELRNADSNELVKKWVTPSGWHEEENVQLEQSYDTGPFGEATQPSTWNLVVTNTSSSRVKCTALLDGVYARLFLERTDLSSRMLNHTLKVLLEALTPRVTINTPIFGNVIIVKFGDEISALTDGAIPTELRIPFDPPSFLGEQVDLVVEFVTFDVALRPGRDALSKVDEQTNKDDEWKSYWKNNIRPDSLTLFSQATATDQAARVEFWILGADIKKVSIGTFLVFGSDLRGANPLILTPAVWDSSLLTILGLVGGPVVAEHIPEVSKLIEEKLAPVLGQVSIHFGRYLGEMLLRVATGGGRVFCAVTCDGQNVSIRYTGDPDSPGGPARHPPPRDLGSGGPAIQPSDGTDPTLGVVPPEFVINDPETLQRLDQIDTIVVLMMENRSFDHLLGDLRMSRGEQYEGLTGTEYNPNRPGVSGSVQVQQASHWLDPSQTLRPVTQIMVSPDHGFEHVKVQVDGGRMDGFVRDYATRLESIPEAVMAYYTQAELPSYYSLAANFCVADHWFAAHPGPTWPNRWITLTGQTPELENFNNSDPRLGFMGQGTIFDILRGEGIDFRYFEHNLSVLRMFGAYRTDDHFIAPYEPPCPERREWEQWDDHFHAVAARGQLPPVVFIDPNFVDIPPFDLASDDLAPADLSRGQEFVADVYNTLIASPQWPRILFVITYDEHGGFFDHVPPPGTPAGPPEWIGKIPRVHPNGADHLGVRLPAFIISPWVGGGSVCKTVFDHTAIIKTILVRHRARLHSSAFTTFGPRVNTANHLGAALNLQHPRTDAPPPIPRRFQLNCGDDAPPIPLLHVTDRPAWDSQHRARPTYSADQTDFTTSLCRAMVPRIAV